MSTAKGIFVAAWEIIEVVFIATVTVFIIRSFLVQPFVVSGASMEPTFSERDYLLIDEITYRFREPKRGEVIVFRYPLDKRVFFIKRIIGMPGEEVISQQGKIKILKDGEEISIQEDYIPPSSRFPDSFKVELNENQFFVLGDNRLESFDSKNWGAIPRENIIGIARVRVFPFGKIDYIEAPVY